MLGNTRRYSSAFEQRILSSIYIAALLLLVVLIVGAWQCWALEGTLGSQAALVNASAAERDWLLQLVNEETGVRGYVATAEPKFLEIYHQSLPQEMADAEIVNSAVGQSPRLLKSVARSQADANNLQDYFKSEIALVRSGNAASARTNLPNGRALFDRMRGAESAVAQELNHQVQAGGLRTAALIKMAFVGRLMLIAALILFVAFFTLVVRRAQHYRMSSLRDPLTGIGNRTRITVAIAELIAAPNPEQFGVLFIDLDGFKKINDAYGHSVGDTILSAVAKRIRGELRDSDVAGRLGGDEFVCIISPLTDGKQLDVISARVKKAVSRPFRHDGEDYVVGCSVGASLYPEDGITIGALLERADRAMYAVKQGAPAEFALRPVCD
jgi:diguanylate cyclase (GGDEF)-like protein